MRNLLIMATASLLLLAACSSANDAPISATATPAATIAVTSPLPALDVVQVAHEDGAFTVEVARTPQERAQGLGGRAAMAADEGMLFDLGSTRVPSFSMRGMLFALDFVWIGEDQRVVQVTADVQAQPDAAPSELRSIAPDAPVHYVLELNAGTAARAGLAAGDQLEFELP